MRTVSGEIVPLPPTRLAAIRYDGRQMVLASGENVIVYTHSEKTNVADMVCGL